MHKLNYVPLILLFLISACLTEEFESPEANKKYHKKVATKNDTTVQKSDVRTNINIATLRLFIKKFKLLSFPVILKPTDPDSLFNCPFTHPDFDTVDAKFSNQTEGLYGLLPDTSRYFAFITLIPADALVPVLSIYSKTGKKIASESLIVRGCTGGPDVLLCSVTSRINSDLSIYCVDSVKTVEVNNLYKPIPGSEKLHVSTWSGKILTNGEITLIEKLR